MSTRQRQVGSISLVDGLAILGIVLYPQNFVALGGLSIGELLMLTWAVAAWLSSFHIMHIPKVDLLLWVGFLSCIVTGSIIGVHLSPDETQPRQLFTWVYFFFIYMTLLMRLGILGHRRTTLIIRAIGLSCGVFYGFLLAYGMAVSRSLFGVDLFFGDLRFAGGSLNPHHTAILLSACVGINLWSAYNSSTVWRRCSAAISGLGCLAGVIATEASTAYVSLAIGLLSLQLLYLIRPNARSLRRTLMYLLLTVEVALLPMLIRHARSFIHSDANGEGRLELLAEVPSVIARSPMFGLGPGVHANGGQTEFHNTVAEVLVMSGILGLICFIAMCWRIVWACAKNDLLLALPVSIVLAYGLAGFSARRLVFWGVLAMANVLVLAVWPSRVQDSSSSNSNGRERHVGPTQRRLGIEAVGSRNALSN